MSDKLTPQEVLMLQKYKMNVFFVLSYDVYKKLEECYPDVHRLAAKREGYFNYRQRLAVDFKNVRQEITKVLELINGDVLVGNDINIRLNQLHLGINYLGREWVGALKDLPLVFFDQYFTIEFASEIKYVLSMMHDFINPFTRSNLLGQAQDQAYGPTRLALEKLTERYNKAADELAQNLIKKYDPDNPEAIFLPPKAQILPGIDQPKRIIVRSFIPGVQQNNANPWQLPLLNQQQPRLSG